MMGTENFERVVLTVSEVRRIYQLAAYQLEDEK